MVLGLVSTDPATRLVCLSKDCRNSTTAWVDDEPGSHGSRPRLQFPFAATVVDSHRAIENRTRSALSTDSERLYDHQMQNFPSGLQPLFRLSVGSNRACYTRERQYASDHEIASPNT
jgi:hypothetical protein